MAVAIAVACMVSNPAAAQAAGSARGAVLSSGERAARNLGADAGGRMQRMTERGGSPAAQAGRRLGLGDLVSLAITTHPSVGARRSEFQAAEADVQSARWQYFPTPSATARHDQRGGTTSLIAVQQPIWAGGRLDAGVDVANARARSADLSIIEAQHGLALNVTAAYQSWLQAQGRVEALERSVYFHEEQARSLLRRIDGGVSAEVDLTLVNSRAAQARGDLAAARASLRTAVSALSQQVGQPLDAGEIAAPVAGDGSDAPELDAVIRGAGQYYPALRRIEADIDAAQHEVELKRASAWPTLSLRAESQRLDPALTGSDTSTANRIMLAVDYAPGAGLSVLSNIDAAAARAAGLRDSRESIRRDMLEKIVAAHEEYSAGRLRRADLLQTRQSAADVLASYSRLFVAGKRGWLDVLNAARELTQVDIGLADVDAQVAGSASRLRLYGGEPAWYRAGTGI